MSAYFELNGEVLCTDCAEKAREAYTSGSPIGRFIKAGGAGLVAAILGALLYYAISALTGYEFGLIAIVVGFAVGAAVRWGASGHGGWAYQGLAMALTYFAIVSTYVPFLIEEMRKPQVEQTGTAQAGEESPAPATGAEPVKVSGEAAAAGESAPETVTAAQGIAAMVVLVAIVAALPFLGGFENIMGIIIIGIGLYEAWKLNQRVPFELSGPHAVRGAAAPSA
jgi:hypothetical protein